MLRILTHQAEGVAPQTRTVTLVHPQTGAPLPGVSVVVRMMDDDTYKALERSHRELINDPKAGRLDFKVDMDAVIKAVLVASVVSWAGVAGADGKPLPCTPQTVVALDAVNRSLVATAARLTTDVCDPEVVAQASFREPAAVV